MVSITPLSRTVTALLTLLFGLLLALNSALLRADSLSASVDRSQLALDETLTLSLRLDSRDTSAEPDISAVEPFFEVLGRSQSSQLRSINGKTSAFTQWQYSLAPKQQGLIQIPAFELQGARSEALQVQVTAPQVSAKSGDYFLERDLQPQSLYPGQQLRVRVRLNTAVGLSELQITPLTVEGARLVELEDRQYQRTLNGRPYLVYEKNYALFAQQPGTLELPAQMLSAVKGGSRSVFDLNRGQTVRLRTEAQQIEVKAPPASAGDDWLPADSLKLKQWLETGVSSIYAGEPVTLNLSLETEGADPARLPGLTPPTLDGVRVYPEPVDDQQQAGADGLQISRTQRVGLVPTQPGTLTLPASRVRWWNSRAGEFSEARTEPITLTVLPPRQGSKPAPSAQIPATTATPAQAAAATTPAIAAATADDTTQRAPKARAQDDTDLSPWLLWSNLAWAGLCGLLALGWWRARQRSRSPELPAATATDMPNRQLAERQLQQACRQGNPAQIRRAILDWADACQLTGSQAPSLARIAALGDAALQAELAALDRALFAPEATATAAPDAGPKAGPDSASKAATAVNAERLISGLKSLHGSTRRTDTTAALAELYPQ
ncbi:BatD family protein [Marinobacterium sedimentorum]|uniref:BatD family protein n=1 Tax=Marinobacterium sedimentorum TaxID=2927804 RepID=UPI0020C6BCBE|nr:BatD family protein [Marinobacterium sedimentorum]MCP8690062.1 BatD family protein [Marinobacterium sedimentorum]